MESRPWPPGSMQSATALPWLAFCSKVPVAPFDGTAARVYGAVRLASRERRRDPLDKLIAAHALALDVTLVTNNPRDFVSYAGLRIENWVD